MPDGSRDDALVAWLTGSGDRVTIADVDETAWGRTMAEDTSADLDDSLDAVFAMVGDWDASD